MKGIVLAGGNGTRLWPMTRAVVKQLLPVYDKPLVYYPLSTLMLAGIRDILVITRPQDRGLFESLLEDGRRLGISLRYAVQPRPGGIAEAFVIGEDFIDGGPVALVLGDNIHFGHGLPRLVQRAARARAGATVFVHKVADPERYGVLVLDAAGRPADILEKPKVSPSPYAVTGLYFYDGGVVDIARSLRPSARGELEITDVNRRYLAEGRLVVEHLGRGHAWFDTGTPLAMLQAAEFVHAVEQRQGQRIACLEEIAFAMGFIGRHDLFALAEEIGRCDYGRYLASIAAEPAAVLLEPS
jgi:glucose-1-phosphate thymidylyltransferase